MAKSMDRYPFGSFFKSFYTVDLSAYHTDELKTIVKEAAINSDFPRAYAALREIFLRINGIKLFENQIAAAYSMQLGRVAELPTGEGKTFSAALFATVMALLGRSVHVLVFNDYLAKRDCLWNAPLYDYFGISSAYITDSTPPQTRFNAYKASIVYMSAKEAGFDYLRNFLATNEDEVIFPGFDVGIVDEADSILIDESRIPLILAGETHTVKKPSVLKVDDAVSSLGDGNFEIKRESNQVWLTEAGIEHVERSLAIDNLYTQENAQLLALTEASLRAHTLLSRDKDYIVRENTVEVIDESTGRVALSRRFPGLLHDAVEAKEGIFAKDSTRIYNIMTMQAFLLHYPHLCGMTGTMATAKDVLWDLYELELDVIAPHTPCIRKDYDVTVLKTADEKLHTVLEAIQSAHKRSQPVLLGTESVQESEKYSAELDKLMIPHTVLNAKNDELEAELISRAGEASAVTVSTNMAGRGVDIRLGGKDSADYARVAAAGGLLVISTTLNRSRRIDNQLKGRSARQGDPGESRFFASLDDDLLLLYKDEIAAATAKRKPPTQKQMNNFAMWSQKEAEGQDAQTRKALERYSYILEQQRVIITQRHEDALYSRRKQTLLSEADPQFFAQCAAEHGEKALMKAENQLIMYYINRHWSDYIETMEQTKESIHLSAVGGENPLVIYNQTAIEAFTEMEADIESDVLEAMHSCAITDDGIDMKANGLLNSVSTFTYMQDDSSTQFSRLPFLVKTTKNSIKGTVFSLKDLFRKK